MPNIKLIAHDGTEYTAEAGTGENVMNVALDNMIPGIDGDCGGACACGTCHVYVSAQWLEKLPEISVFEESMLAMRPDRKENSRLCCQIDLSDDLDGFEAVMPELQM